MTDLHTIPRLPTGIFYAEGVKSERHLRHRPAAKEPQTREVWYYDYRTPMEVLNTNAAAALEPLEGSALPLIAQFQPEDSSSTRLKRGERSAEAAVLRAPVGLPPVLQPGELARRKATRSEENPEGRWRRFTRDELLARDKGSLDLFWLKDKSLTDPERRCPGPQAIWCTSGMPQIGVGRPSSRALSCSARNWE